MRRLRTLIRAAQEVLEALAEYPDGEAARELIELAYQIRRAVETELGEDDYADEI